jgi:predicted ArsR family transcriptional regulator
MPNGEKSPGRYPDHPGTRRGALPTSQQAADAFAPKAKPIRQRALEALRRGPATAEQIGQEIGVHFMVVRARLSEARAKGLVEDTGVRGRGALGGKVVVWSLTEAARNGAGQ